ncbi:spermidine/putrescine ABC transporter substrate-binding protein [Leucobacter sp. CSA1]|uniref:Spermidine/putrescine ABC transporter substrate-binding protein n=1 Tax=Leucobacter chromiisoli TaxID=2796471 RepID=A0A934Q9D7_9MICO|nr:spermidine/putrescine ABC transporter substrate-binding protein [Leucobacter chromiisoli]MBK0419551.1 spermidine/putrescine ABC transporter substrate-binding protein [Leucobacter chromiisoli]
MIVATGETVEERVSAAVDAWLRWVPRWTPGTHRGRARLCRRCTGSPFLTAAGLGGDVPHQVTHALVSRMQRIIDRRVDDYTAAELPALHAELSGAEMWATGGFDPSAGLAPEYEGIDPDPEPADSEQPFLFTFSGLAEESRPEPPLPRPPLSAEEKRRLQAEIELADRCAEEAGRQVCFALMAHRHRVEAAVHRFVEPQIRSMLDELSRHLEPPQ